MTTKQLLFSVLILGATTNIASGMDIAYGYPELYKCNLCELDIKQYEKQYRNAEKLQLKDIQKSADILREIYPEKHVQYIIELHKSDIKQKLDNGLSYIKKQQQLCPAESSVGKRNKSEQFASLICHLNHEQQ